MKKGYIHVYTGNGKGKTTAALGLCFRAKAAGFNIEVIQFLKNKEYSEIKGLKEWGIKVHQSKTGFLINRTPKDRDKEAATALWARGKEVLEGKRPVDLLLMDELNIALYYKFIELDQVLEALRNKPDNLEVVITGRYAPNELIQTADLVTEMKMVKHYYKQGVPARLGIEY
ncbi:cob(I)yrinic acid a,c-diamide adenosyltransferase [Spirochaeta cellobiosiphila]|uniref:cob(I)yrinic acid a,c-diamide adenosyltransferase n=1 Tax=Spirochaeta cellobiosiphila TaxID=504483 RepID=UPI000405236B|nr:cob(I)yrinic acid a,c-diamide adenosyltransferase [Spirochaeta cellobiosiphila]